MTSFNALRHSGARPGSLVAVLGPGGLGHLAVQYAVKMGHRVVAIASGPDKASLARQLGAFLYIDSTAQDPAAELQKLGGADLILATVTRGEAMSAVQGGLAVNGTMILLGSPMKMQISPRLLIMGRRTIRGWASGTALDSRDTLLFSVWAGVRSVNEVFPLERAGEAYERMASGRGSFRVVLEA